MPLEVVQVINLFVPGITDLANWISVPCGIILIVLLCQKTKWVENSSFVNSQSPQSFGQQPVQSEQFGQPPQQSQEQQNISVQEEQQSTQLTDNSFETKD